MRCLLRSACFRISPMTAPSPASRSPPLSFLRLSLPFESGFLRLPPLEILPGIRKALRSFLASLLCSCPLPRPMTAPSPAPRSPPLSHGESSYGIRIGSEVQFFSPLPWRILLLILLAELLHRLLCRSLRVIVGVLRRLIALVAVDGDDLLSLLGLSDVDESLLQCLLQTIIHNL